MVNRQDKTRLVWQSALIGPSGYAEVGRNILLALTDFDIEMQAQLITEDQRISLRSDTVNKLAVLFKRRIKNAIYICHYVPALLDGRNAYQILRDQNPGHIYYIGSTMFETDRIPQSWVESCNVMDEIWVPTHFNLKTFTNSGVNREKIVIMPFGVNPGIFNPEKTLPLELPGKRGFTFLSVFEWSTRKGWDILISSYLKAFTSEDDVSLFIHSPGEKGEAISTGIMQYIHSLGYEVGRIPHLRVIETLLSDDDIARLYASCDAFVLPSRGEGWGLPYMEAMAMGLPVIGTRWSGNMEFMNDENSYLINIDGLVDVDEEHAANHPFYTGHKWAQPSLEDTARLMRHVYENHEEARLKGKKARQSILDNWTVHHTAEKIIRRFHEIELREALKNRCNV